MDSTRELRERMVDELYRRKVLHSARVAGALLEVPRHVFLPDVEPTRAYRDEPFVTKSRADGIPVSGSTQPAIMAIMLEQLDVRLGHRVLEIGTGTGYNAALLAFLAGEEGTVITVDLDEDLAAAARERLAAAAYSRVKTVAGDGGFGWSPDAPYDRVILTIGAWDLAPAWADQLASGGRLVLPLSLCGWVQYSIALERMGDHLESLSISPCGFMRLRGAFAGPGAALPLGTAPGVFVGLGEDRNADMEALSAALASRPGEDIPTGVRITAAGIADDADGLDLWLALNEPRTARLMAMGAAPSSGLVPPLLVAPGLVATDMLPGADGCAALVRRTFGDAEDGSFELVARPFGAGGEALARRLADQVRAWEKRGRLSTATLRVSIYPPGAPTIPENAIVVDRPHARIVLTSQAPATAEKGR